MLRLSELKLPLDHPEDALLEAVLKRLRIPPNDVFEQRMVKRSIDARRRDQIQLIYSVDVRVRGEAALLRRLGKTSRVRQAPDTTYRPVAQAPRTLLDGGDAHRPVVVGAGPCGYFAPLLLAQMGLRPLLLERGEPL